MVRIYDRQIRLDYSISHRGLPPRAQFANSNSVEHLEHCPMRENVDRKTRRVEPHFDSEEGRALVMGTDLYVQVSVGKCE